MNNSTQDWWREPIPPPSTLNNILIWLFMLALVVTLVINTITVVVMVTTARLRTHTNAFIVSLAVSDILFSSYSFIINVLLFSNPFYLSTNFEFYRRLVHFAWFVQIHGCYGNLLLVSLERWLFIAKPFFYQRYVTTRAVVCSITTTSVVSLVVNVPYLCIHADSVKFYEALILTYINPVIHTALFFVLLAIYTHICLITLRHLKKSSKHDNYQQTRRNSNMTVARERLSLHAKNLKSIKLLVSICSTFFLFVSPNVYYHAYINIHEILRDELLYNASLMLFGLFHCSNFFVYALGIPLFRTTLRNQCCKLLCSCKGSNLRHGEGIRSDLMRK